MDKPEITPTYEHGDSPSVYDMFTKDYEVVRSYSGDNVASIYEQHLGGHISGPLELPIPMPLDRILTDYYDNP